MSPPVLLVLLWFAFAATHMGLSSLPARRALSARLGDRGFLGLYTLVAFATFVPLVWVYVANRHTGPLLWAWSPGAGLRWALYVPMGLAWILVVAALMQPSPVALGAPERTEPVGALRITRHPLFMGLGLWAALHLVLVPAVHAAEAVFFGGFVLFTLAGCAHQDRRVLAQRGASYRAWIDRTSFLPLPGRGLLQGLREMPPAVPVIGVALTVALRWLHDPLLR